MTFLAVIGASVLALPIVFGIIIGLLVWRSWWLYPAWSWFIVPLGAPAISFWHFMALTFLLGILSSQVETKKDDRPEDPKIWASKFCMPIIAWVVLKWLS